MTSSVKKGFLIRRPIHPTKIPGHFRYFVATDYLSGGEVSEMGRPLESIRILKSMRVLGVLCCATYSHMVFVEDYAHAHPTANSCP